ncbi:hypothetical protein LA080_016316 [Diaporthe eres]|nr:hypothetical protein LA080_016316 [Diaporthe eres]
MAPSIVSVRTVAFDAKDGADVKSAKNLGELCSLVPAPYSPRMGEVINTVYSAAVKANHVRSYIVGLEKHKVDHTFPPEIEGRVGAPVLQISKEYLATAPGKAVQVNLDTWAKARKSEVLDIALLAKKAELGHLQTLTSDDSYAAEVADIIREVTRDLILDSGGSLKQDGTFDHKTVPEFLMEDFNKMQKHGRLFPARALAIAHMTIQREMTSKMKALSLKRDGDGDVQMQDNSTSKDSVAMLIRREVERLQKENKLHAPGSGMSRDALRTRDLFSNANLASEKSRTEREGAETYQQPTQEKIQRQGAAAPDQRRRKRKREWEEQVSKEMKLLERCERSGRTAGGPGVVPVGAGWDETSSLGHGNDPSLYRQPARATAWTRVAGRGRTLESTAPARSFLEKHPVLWNSLSDYTRRTAVFSHMPMYLAEYNHDFASGIFMGPGVSIPKDIEYAISVNTKFILHRQPDVFRVHEAWPKLERSVRLRWHFRDSKSRPSKFYVPKKEWQPPAEERNPWIEKGLAAGKDLLFRQSATAVLHLGQTRRPNPDLARIHDLLRSSQFLVKITDKNLGLAVVEKNWYISEVSKMLSDSKTYRRIEWTYLDEIRDSIRFGFSELLKSVDLPASTREYLNTWGQDVGIPHFHGIPKVHKETWSLRPIIPSHSWATRKFSEVADFLLRQCIKEVLPWCIESTRVLMQKLEEVAITRSDDVWLVTGDVQSFYTNVPIEATTLEINKRLGDRSYDGISTRALGYLLMTVMTCNCFEFNGDLYHQEEGVAMGTSCAPAFANLSLGFKEINSQMLRTSKRGLAFYVRYIDDIFLVYQGSRQSLESWLEKFTPYLEPYTISWEVHSSREATPFLDAEFFFRQGHGPMGLQSKVYRKRMNKHQYIPWSSAHPETVKRAFVKAELTRFMTICSSQDLFEERVDEFMQALGRRGYPSDILHRWRRLVRYRDRMFVLAERKDKQAGLPLMLPSSYDEIWEYLDVRSVLNVMRQHWVQAGPLPDSLQGPLIKSLRRTENLFDKISAWNKAVLNDSNGVPETTLGSRAAA